MAKRFWCTEKEVEEAFKAEGFQERGLYWRYNIGRMTAHLSTEHIIATLKVYCPLREDLPRFVLEDEETELIECIAIKRVASRILQGGPV